MQFKIVEKTGTSTLPVKAFDEILIELTGKGSMAPTVDIDTDGDKTVVKFTYSNDEGGVQNMTVRVHPSSEEE